MVFILLGAVKAAKTAKLEFDKEKKRTALIVPVDGSHDMLADRAASSANPATTTTTTSAAAVGADHWWGTARPHDAVTSTATATANHAGDAASHRRTHSAVGAWSRNRPADPPQLPSSSSSSASASLPALPAPAPACAHASIGSRSSASDRTASPPRGEVPLALPEPSASPENQKQQQQPQITRRVTATAALDRPAPATTTAAASLSNLNLTGPADRQDDGSFAAAMRDSGRRRHVRANTIATAAELDTLSHTRSPGAAPVSAMPANLVRKQSRPTARAMATARPPAAAPGASGLSASASADAALASAIPSITPVRKQIRSRKTASVDTAGSFAEAMRSESSRPPRPKKDLPDGASLASSARAGPGKAKAKHEEGDAGQARTLTKHKSAMAYPAGSKVKTRQGAQGPRSDSNPAAVQRGAPDSDVCGKNGEVQSSLRKEGSMKRRVLGR